MEWRGRGRGIWPGRGPFSNLPPWQRPGWVYGRGACWWLLDPNAKTTLSTNPDSTVTSPIVPRAPFMPTLSKDQEIDMLEQQMQFLKTQLDAFKKRLDELNQ